VLQLILIKNLSYDKGLLYLKGKKERLFEICNPEIEVVILNRPANLYDREEIHLCSGFAGIRFYVCRDFREKGMTINLLQT